jgi:hypothetical protein
LIGRACLHRPSADDYTTKWFVVQVLQRFFYMSETSATARVMAIRYAREFEMPLLVTAEPDEDF